MDNFDVFRVKPDGAVLWIGSADSVDVAQGMIKRLSGSPSETFLIHDYRANETLTVCFSGGHGDVGNPAKPVTSNLADSPDEPGKS